MYKVRTARSEFKGTCGHEIKSGDKFIVAEQRPQFNCNKCGAERIREHARRLLAEVNEAVGRVAKAAEERGH